MTYVVHVFGKKSCAKCAMLNKRLDEILTKEPWKDHFIKVYNDLETEDGLMNFCLAQSINPNRVPGMVVAKYSADGLFMSPVFRSFSIFSTQSSKQSVL